MRYSLAWLADADALARFLFALNQSVPKVADYGTMKPYCCSSGSAACLQCDTLPVQIWCNYYVGLDHYAQQLLGLALT
jgi:hypothetical protein